MSAKFIFAWGLKSVFIISLALLSGCDSPGGKTANQPDQPHFTEIQTKGTYVHAPTGMEFPESDIYSAGSLSYIS